MPLNPHCIPSLQFSHQSLQCFTYFPAPQRFSAAPVRWWPWSDATRWRTVPRSPHHQPAAPGGGSFATIRRWAAHDVVATNRPAAGGADRCWATAHNSTPTRDRLSCFCHRPGVPGEVVASRRPRRWWWWLRKSRTRFREGLWVFVLFIFSIFQQNKDGFIEDFVNFLVNILPYGFASIVKPFSRAQKVHMYT